MKKYHLYIFIVVISWKTVAGITSVKEEISSTEQNDTGIETHKEHSREGKHYGSFGSFGSYGSGSSSSEAFDVTVVKQLECPFAYTEVDELCLAYQPCIGTSPTFTNFTFLDARTYCQRLDTGGGDLVTFKDSNEYQSIVNYIQQMDPTYTCSYWLGATTAASNSPYQFVDGTSLSNSGPFWYTGEPPATLTTNLNVIFAEDKYYRLVTADPASFAGAICQYRPGNVTLTQRIFPRRPPQVIPIPYPVEIEGKGGGGAGGGSGSGGGGSSNVTTNLDVSLAGSNFSSEQNANFQNAPVINIETHSHFIDSSPEIIPIPSYPLPANGTSYGSPPYPQPGYPYNTYVPHPHYYNPSPKPGGEYGPIPSGGYLPGQSGGYLPGQSGGYLPGQSGGYAQWPMRVNNPLPVHRPHSVIHSGNSNVPNQLPPKLVSRDDKIKAPNRTNVQKINKESFIPSRPKSHPQVFNSVHVERVDGFKQRSRDPVPPLYKMTPPINQEISSLIEEVPPLNKENEEQKEPENVASQLTLLLDMIDKKYGDPNDNILKKNQSMAHPIGNVSKAEEAAYLIKIMNELQAMILKIEHMEHASRINTNKRPPTNPPNRQKHKNPIIGSRRMQGSRLLDI